MIRTNVAAVLLVAATALSLDDGRTIKVGAGDNLQAALDKAAKASDDGPVTVLVGAGEYSGSITLPARTSDHEILITADPSTLPRAGVRIDLSYAGKLPRIVADTRKSALGTAPGAKHFTIRGLEFAPLDRAERDMIWVDGDEDGRMSDPATEPHHITFDQVIIRGDEKKGLHRGMRLNGAHLTVTNSWIDRCFEFGRESQAIASLNGSGPFRIENNYLEASGENYLLGGAPLHLKVTPAGLTFRRNHLAKNPEWKSWTPKPVVKNLFELKVVRGAVIEQNVLEYNWKHAQTGWAILFTPKTGTPEFDGDLIRVEDVVFRDNVVRHVASAINIAVVDGPVRGVRILNNLFEDVSKAKWGGDGKFLQIASGASDIEVGHNTVVDSDGTAFLSMYKDRRAPHVSGLRFHHNIVHEGQYGIFGNGGLGSDALERLAPDAVFENNAIYDTGTRKIRYPSSNLVIPAGENDVARLRARDGTPIGYRPGFDERTVAPK